MNRHIENACLDADGLEPVNVRPGDPILRDVPHQLLNDAIQEAELALLTQQDPRRAVRRFHMRELRHERRQTVNGRLTLLDDEAIKHG